MKTAIVIPSFGRLDCLQRCLESLKSSASNVGASTIIVPDLVDEGEYLETVSIGVSFGCMVSQRPPERMYGCRNQFRAVRLAFDMGFEQVIRLDADMVVSSAFCNVLINASKWLGGPSISRISCEIPLEQKLAIAGLIDRGCHSGSNIVWSKESWRECSPIIDEYERLFMKNKGHIHNNDAYEWLSRKAMASNSNNHWNRESITAFVEKRAGTVGDALQHCALACSGLPYGSLAVNRLIHISNSGENTNADVFDQLYSRTTLDEIDGDAERTEFAWA